MQTERRKCQAAPQPREGMAAQEAGLHPEDQQPQAKRG